MSYIINLVILGLISLIASSLLTFFLVKIMPKLGIVDIPSTRRSNKKVTPRGGGVAFILIFSTLLPIFEYVSSGNFLYSIDLMKVFLPLAFISFLDDINGVSVVLRFIFHVVCSTFAILLLVHPSMILHNEISTSLDWFIGSFALLTFLNIYNFLDGIDGITVSESLHLSVSILLLCVIRYDIIPNADIIIAISTIILGWSVGFYYFNWQPAKIFLGDVGSIALGFVIGLCLLTVASASIKLFISCVIASLYYVLDGGLTILLRISKREKIWEPHLQHFFHKAVLSGKSHKRVVKRIIKCNILLMIFSVNALYYPVVSIICAIITVVITLIRSVK